MTTNRLDEPGRKASLAVILGIMAMALSVQVAWADIVEKSVTLDGTSYTATENGTIESLVVVIGSTGNGIVVPSGVTLTVIDYDGAGALTKTGDGTLVLHNVDSAANISVDAGKVLFDRSTGVESLTGAAAMHLDASKASSVATSKSGNDTVVDRWYDVRDTPSSSTYANMKYEQGNGLRAPVRAGYQNGLAVIDTLPASSDKTKAAYFNVANLQGTDKEGDNNLTYGGPGIKGIEEVFMVVEDNPGASGGSPIYQSFLTDQWHNGRTFWLRGTGGAYWSATDTWADGARNGQTWLDGTQVSSPTTTPFPSSGMHLLRVRRSASASTPGRFQGLSQERTSTYGGLKYGEMIAFRSALDDATAARITTRLTHKWFGRHSVNSLTVAAGAAVDVVAGEKLLVPLANGGKMEYSSEGTSLVIGAGETCTVEDDLDVPSIRAEGDGATLNVPVNATVTAETLTGARLVKMGEGTLEITDVAAGAKVCAAAGLVSFAKSAGVESLTGAAAMHLDASKASSVATSKSGNDMVVDKWYDVRDTPSSSTYAYMKYPNWGLRAPVRADYQNGLAVIDTLAANSAATATAYFDVANMQGTDATGNEDYVYGAPGIKDIWEVFMVVEDNPGTSGGSPIYQSFLTDQWNNWRIYWARGADGAYWASSGDQVAGARNGKTWLDGVQVASPTTTPFPSSGMHLLRVQRSEAGRFKGLSQDRDVRFGGLKYGEMIAFRSKLDDATAARITTRLTHKWFGRQCAEVLEIGAEGHVQVAAGETLSVDSLTLAHLDATVGFQPFKPTTATLADSGTVNLTVPAGVRLRSNQEITLVEAENDIVGAANVANWTVSCNATRKLTLKVDGKRLYAQVDATGFFLVIE